MSEPEEYPKINEAEKARRRRVVHGWAFRTLSDGEVADIRAYLRGGPAPDNYIGLDRVVK